MASKFRKKINNPMLNIQRIRNDVKKHFPEFSVEILNNKLIIVYTVKPSELSNYYQVKIIFNGVKRPSVYVIDPDIKKIIKSPIKVHVFKDYSLCLYYNNKWLEFDVQKDVFSDTIIPWTSLWLYYFELWQFSGEWLGGGYHPY